MSENDTTAYDTETVSLAVAAKALGVTRRTIERWIEIGKLQRVRDGSRSFIPVSALHAMRASMQNGAPDPAGNGESGETVVPLPLSRYEELIAENAALKRQAQFLIEDLQAKEAAEKVLEATREKVVDQERLIGRLEGELQAVQRELAERKQSIWRRLWSRAKYQG